MIYLDTIAANPPPAHPATATDDSAARVMAVLMEIRPAPGASAYMPDTGLTDAGFTSLDMVKVMLGVEAAFDIMIPQADITPGNFTSSATIVALVRRLRDA